MCSGSTWTEESLSQEEDITPKARLKNKNKKKARLQFANSTQEMHPVV